MEDRTVAMLTKEGEGTRLRGLNENPPWFLGISWFWTKVGMNCFSSNSNSTAFLPRSITGELSSWSGNFQRSNVQGLTAEN